MEKSNASKTLLSFVLFRTTTPPNSEAVLALANKLDPNRPMKLEKSPSSDRTQARFVLDDTSVVVQFVSVPVPENNLDAFAAKSHLWRKEQSAKHQAHAIVVALGNGPVQERITANSRICAALVASGQGVGVLQDTAELVISPDVYEELVLASKGDWIPMLELWVRFPVSIGASGAHSISTFGMEAFGHREFESVDCLTPRSELRDLVFDLCVYVLEKGPILLDGQTFGRKAGDHWPIEVGPSKLAKDGTVIRVGVP